VPLLPVRALAAGSKVGQPVFAAPTPPPFFPARSVRSVSVLAARGSGVFARRLSPKFASTQAGSGIIALASVSLVHSRTAAPLVGLLASGSSSIDRYHSS